MDEQEDRGGGKGGFGFQVDYRQCILCACMEIFLSNSEPCRLNTSLLKYYKTKLKETSVSEDTLKIIKAEVNRLTCMRNQLRVLVLFSHFHHR